MPTIVVADRDELIRECVAVLLNEVPDFAIVGQCSDGAELIEAVTATLPDVAVVATNLPDMDVSEAARLIAGISPASRVIAMSKFPGEFDAGNMMSAGISGQVHKDISVSDLVKTIRTALSAPGVPVPSGIRLVNEGAGRTSNGFSPERLTPRECEVLKLIGEGNSSKQIASRLNISETTVKTYRNRLMDKLDVRDIAGLTRGAVRLRLVRVDQVGD